LRKFSPVREIHATPERPIDKKGEKAQVLFLINAGLNVPKVIGWETIVIASDLPARAWLACWSHTASTQAGAWQSPALRSLFRNAGEESRPSQ